MKAYFDQSGSDGKYLVLTGVAGTDSAWAGFDDIWRNILADRDPKAPYIHMRQLIPLRKPFLAELGWDDQKADRLVTACLLYVQHLDKKNFRTFTCSIDLAEYREFVDNGESLPDIYKICSYFCPEWMIRWYLKNFHEWYPEEMHFYFDQGEKHKGVFEKRWNRGMKSGNGLSNHWHLVKSVTSAISQDTPALQLADVLAWGQNRRFMVENYGTNPSWQHLAKIAESILPFFRKDVCRRDFEVLARAARIYPAALADYQ
jgi:hypothetical protein